MLNKAWSFFTFVSVAVIHGSTTFAHTSNTTITFIENKNQWASTILYKAQLDGGAMYLQKNAFVYTFYDKDKLRSLHGQHLTKEVSKNGLPDAHIRAHAYKMTFVNANTENKISTVSIHPAPDYINYFIGKDRNRWASHVRKFKEVEYHNLYPGIDLEVIGNDNSIKYNFIVAPKASPRAIAMRYEGLEAIAIVEGRLKITTSLNEITEQAPYAYQDINGHRIGVPCKFKLSVNEVAFDFPQGYDNNHPLIIDPTLIFASYSGSLADNFGMTATYDSHGNLFSGGTAFDQGFPTTMGAYDTTYNGIVSYGITDVVVTKYDSSGSNLIYSTYLGGAAGSEIVTSLIVNSQDEIYMYGATGSTDFPVTANAYDTTYNGGFKLRFIRNGTFFDQGTDIFVAKLSADGGSLMGSTYFGGSDNDGVNHNNVKQFSGYYEVINNQLVPVMEYNIDSLQYNYGDQYRGEIMLDKTGNCYVATSTRSSDIPIVNGFDNTLGGMQDALVFKFNSDFSQLLWSTYLGGSDNDAGYSLAVDDSSVVYVAGGTRSAGFPATTGTLNATYRGGKTDGFIVKINAAGNAILKSTFIGTNKYDQCYFIQLDRNKNVYVLGQTEGDFPVSAGVYNNPKSGQFIAKLNNDLSGIVYSTVFGNGGNRVNISPSAFLVDECETVYVSGWGGNILTNVPTTNMPLTSDAIQKTTDGFNFYLFVVSKDAQTLLYATYFGGGVSQEHVDGGTSRFDKRGIIYQSVCAGCGKNSDFPTTPGAWSRTNNSDNCNNGTFKFDFSIKFNVATTASSSCQTQCRGMSTANVSGGTGPFTYLWNPTAQANDTAINLCPGVYTVNVKDVNGCEQTDSVTITVNNVYPTVTATTDEDTLYEGQSTIIHAVGSGIYTYQWSPAIGLANPTSASTVASPPVTTTYTVTIDDGISCKNSAPVIIYVKDVLCEDPEVFIPNGFSPNDDGTNDVLYVRGRTIQEMYLVVYDRWGEKLFESTSPQVGWDGRYKGEKVTPAVYAYYLRVKCINQQEYFKKGNVTVLR